MFQNNVGYNNLLDDFFTCKIVIYLAPLEPWLLENIWSKRFGPSRTIGA